MSDSNVRYLPSPLTHDPDEISRGLVRASNQLSGAQTPTERHLARHWLAHWRWLARLYADQQTLQAELMRRAFRRHLESAGVGW